MKKIIIVLGIVLTSGAAALALSQSNTSTEVKTAQIKADRNELMKTNGLANFKNNIATAD